MTIPRTFHRVWIDDDGTDPIPERFERYWRGFEAMHPGWEFVTWSRTSELGWLRNREAFDAATTHAGRSDVVRYEVVARCGGVYVDTDVEPLRPFDELLYGDPFAGYERERLLCPTVIGGEAGAPALEALVANLARWERARRGRPPNIATGPHYLTAAWGHRTDVRRLPRDAFYPVGWWERDNLGGPYPAVSYAVHHWEQGWDRAAKARIDAAQGSRRA